MLGMGNYSVGAGLLPVMRYGKKILIPGIAINRIEKAPALLGADGSKVSGDKTSLEVFIACPNEQSAETILKTCIVVFEMHEEAKKQIAANGKTQDPDKAPI